MQNFSEYIAEKRQTRNSIESLYASMFRRMQNEVDRDKKIEFMIKLNAIAVHLNDQQMMRLVRRLSV